MGNNSETEKSNKSEQWTMSQEREFIENIVVQRFNFFLLFFTLIVAGAVGVKSEVSLKAILGVGALVSWMISYTLIIANWKLNRILEKLLPDHPYSIIDRDVSHISGRNWIGFWIPVVCSLALTLAFVFALCGHVPVVC